MENLIIDKTISSPGVVFKDDGNFTIEGRSLPENPQKLFEPIFHWLQYFHSEKVVLTIHLDYLNTNSSLQLFSLLKKIDENSEIKDAEVIWYYEEDDEDHLETGIIYADQLQNVRFKYCKEAA